MTVPLSAGTEEAIAVLLSRGSIAESAPAVPVALIEQPAAAAEEEEHLERRSSARRHRYTVKEKFKALVAIEKTRNDLRHWAQEEDLDEPTLSQVFQRMQAEGCQIATSTLCHFFEDRVKIVDNYLVKKKGKRRSVGSGRAPMLPKTEAAVKELIFQKRERSLRVSRAQVKVWLREKAQVLEPEAALKLRWSNTYFRSAFHRMSVVVRRISSSKAVDNETAAQYGRFFCKQIMELRRNGFSKFFPDRTWCESLPPDSVFGFFRPEHVFAADEVPFNFAEDGKTVSIRGMDAAVQSLRGTGKRFGTCVMVCSAAGELLKFVVIFKAVKRVPEAEAALFKKEFPNVIVAWTKSSYITEDVWSDVVVDKVLLAHLVQAFGRDVWKRRYLFLSDNHSSHQTKKVLENCQRSCVFAAFTPPNYTSHWSLIDDYVGTSSRQIIYKKAEQYEARYFEENPKGDGGIPIALRRKLVVQWWNEAFMELQAEEFRIRRSRAAQRVGLWLTPKPPVDTNYLPRPVRFQDTKYACFGETLYDPHHPDFQREKLYDFGFPNSDGVHEVPVEAAKDEDGHSFEEEDVWRNDEAEEDDDSANAPSEDDVDVFRLQAAERRRVQKVAAPGKIVDQMAALAAAESARKKRK